MSIYPNVTEQKFFSLRKLAEEQKNQKALKVKNRFLKQTHDINLAENLSPITKKLGEKFEKNPQLAMENSKLVLEKSRSQTLKLVSASDE